MAMRAPHAVISVVCVALSFSLFGTSAFCQTPTRQPATTAIYSAGSLAGRYQWLTEEPFAADSFTTLEARFAPPPGYTRVAVADASFAAFLRALPLRTDRKTVLSHAGQRLSSPSAAVVAMDVGERNLQQCADSIIRLHAEYLWASNRQANLAYHFTSGDETRWEAWRNGERFKVKGSKVERVRTGRVDNSRAQFRRWLDTVFMYAGTRSLRLDSRAISPRDIQPGDFFVAPGSPGHAVIVLDIAVDAADRRVALLGQGFMPAQELHVIQARGARVLDQVWFMLPDEGQTLQTPSWQAFTSEQIRRFNAI